MSNIAIIVQARMTSRRLPGKVLRPLEGWPMLGHLLARLRRCRPALPLVVATSDTADDDPIVEFCRKADVDCHRGPLDDVAARFAGVVRHCALDAFVRVCADSPLLDPTLIDRAVASLVASAGRFDVVTNVRPRTFPAGQSVEAVRAAAFLEHEASMTDPADREHVTRFLYRHLRGDRVCNFRRLPEAGNVRLAVDTADDLDRVARIMAAMDGPQWRYGLDEILELAALTPPSETGSMVELKPEPGPAPLVPA